MILRLINWVAALGGIGLTLYIVCSLLSSPLYGMRALAYMIMFFSAAIGINRLLAILQKMIVSDKKRKWFGVLKWLTTFILPLLINGFTEGAVNNRAMNIVKNDLSSVVSSISNYQTKHDKTPDQIIDMLKTVKTLNNLTYYQGDKYYLLSTFASSIDIDGYTIYYYSTKDEWRRFHNDDTEEYSNALKEFNLAVKDLNPIEFRHTNGKWEGRGGYSPK